MQDYSYNGLAGCVVQCMSLPGVPVGLYHAKQAQLDQGGGPWVTVCETHNTLVNHRTLELAQEHLFLVDWCEACQAAFRVTEEGRSDEKRLKAQWSEDGRALMFRRPGDRPPLRVEAARSHDPLILQKPGSFVAQFTYTVADYQGCEYGCRFCYVPRILHSLPDKLGGWGNYTQPRFRCVEHLLRQADKLQGARLFFPATTDAYQPVENFYRLTRSLLEQLLDIPFGFLLISTRSGLVLRDLDLFTDHRMCDRIEIGISISSDDERLHRALEPDTPSYAGRFKVAKALSDRGVATRIHAAPLGVHSADFLRKAADCASWVWVDGAGHGARKNEPGSSMLFDYEQARAFAENARGLLGAGRVGYGSAHFGYRWDAGAGRIVEALPAEAMMQRRNLTWVSN